MRIGIAEFLEKVSKLKKPEEKIEALRANDSFVLRIILQSAFDPKINWLLPEGKPPYKPSELTDQENVLIRDARKIAYFIEGLHPNLKQLKREAMFIEMLESVTPKDAELLCALKEKKLPFKGITADQVLAALPGIF